MKVDIRETDKEYFLDADKISAKLENGILSVTLPKKIPAEPKIHRIDIE